MQTISTYYMAGMHLMWWFFWITAIFFVFFYEPVSRKVIYKNTPLDILKRHYASGNMSTEEYYEREKVLKNK